MSIKNPSDTRVLSGKHSTIVISLSPEISKQLKPYTAQQATGFFNVKKGDAKALLGVRFRLGVNCPLIPPALIVGVAIVATFPMTPATPLAVG
jgi:hypothetical protein